MGQGLHEVMVPPGGYSWNGWEFSLKSWVASCPQGQQPGKVAEAPMLDTHSTWDAVLTAGPAV